MENKIAVFILAVLLYSCSGPEENGKDNGNHTLSHSPGIVIDKPARMQNFPMGDTIDVSIRLADPSFTADSVVVDMDNGKGLIRMNGLNGKVTLISGRTGMQSLRFCVYTKDTMFCETQVISCYSNIKPALYSYKILKKFKHDENDYTQGLVYENGFMYEGTGQPKQSQLKKYRLETGELIQSYKMPDEDFGEGIVLHKNFIYQLTWQSGVAYKYEKESFKMINRFVVQTEGWGITNYGDNLIMSDGSNILYVLSPESFDVVKRIEVFDNVGPVGQLNELEYIDGKIYANVYTTDWIVIIDPESGRVEGKINLEGLLKSADFSKDAEVLNGIAWKGEKNRIFVTGKWWPNLFYIEIIP